MFLTLPAVPRLALIAVAFYASSMMASADVLASFVEKDQLTLEDQMKKTGLTVGQLTPSGESKHYTNKEALIAAGYDANLVNDLKQSPVVTSSLTLVSGVSAGEYIEKSMFSFKVDKQEDYSMDLSSLSFNFSSAFNAPYQPKARSGFSGQIPFQFQLMAKVDGVEKGVIAESGNFTGEFNPNSLDPKNQEVLFNLAGLDVLKGASSVEFSIYVKGEVSEAMAGLLNDIGLNLDYNFFIDNVKLDGTLSTQSVPEPSSALLGLFGVLPLFMRRKR